MSTSDELLDRADSYGPMQIWTFSFDGNRFRGEILPELDRLKEAGVIRLIDLIVIRKDPAGRVLVMTASDLEWEEATAFGAVIGGLLGLGVAGEEGAEIGAMAGAVEFADGHLFTEKTRDKLIDVIPLNSTSAIALVEHVWAKSLKAAIARAGGVEIDNDWLRLDELVARGFVSTLPPAEVESGEDAIQD
jgi:uncharacterized membrane protein